MCDQMMNSQRVLSDGRQAQLPRGSPQVKYVDTLNSAVAITSVGTLIGLCPIPQGTGVSQRIGDTVFWKDVYINYIINAANTDVYSSARVILFQWHPNSQLAGPLVSDILQSASILSMYDWQYSNQYTILYDRVHCFSGTSSNPTTSSNQAYFGEVGLKNAVKRGEFAPGVVNGSQQFYMIFISDSTLAPFPNIDILTRVTYSQE